MEERNKELELENAALRQELEKLRREMEEWKRGFRERRKPRTSRAEGPRGAERKKSRRRAGHDAAHRAVPEQIDHEKLHPTPRRCPCRDGPVEATDEIVSTLEVYTGQGIWVNGFCGAHVIREAKKIVEFQPCAETEEFRDRSQAFYELGDAAAKSGDASARRGARIRLGRVTASTNWVDFGDIVRLQERLAIHWDGVTRFLDDPAVP